LTDFDMNHLSIWRLRINHFLRFAGEFRRARANFKAQAGLSPLKEIRCFKQKGKNFPHFAQTAARKQADQVRIALRIDPLGLHTVVHEMTVIAARDTLFVMLITNEGVKPANSMYV